MEKLSACPLCQKKELITIKSYDFQLGEDLQNKTLPENASSTDERLWIYMHHIVHEPGGTKVDICSCQYCGFLFSNPRLSQEDLVLKYQLIADLGHDVKQHQLAPPKYIDSRKKRIKDWITPLVEEKLPRQWTMLDYGGAEGYLLTAYLDQGHKAYLCDYINYQLADNRIKYLGKDMASIPQGLKFDLIFCLHTLEHVADPIKLTAMLAEQLTNKGFLYIEVPLGVWTEWNDVREPITHVNYFSEQSLSYVMQQAGLEVVAIQSNWQYVTHAKHLCINILGRKADGHSNTETEMNVKALSTHQQMQIWRYLSGGLSINFRYYLKQALWRFIK